MSLNLYRVTGEWLVKAHSKDEAENIIENAVAGHTEADLEDCNADIEDADVEATPVDEDRPE